MIRSRVVTHFNAHRGTLDDFLCIDEEPDNMNDGEIPHERLTNLNSTVENKTMPFSEKR